MIGTGLKKAWLVSGPTDMRKSFEGLAGIVESLVNRPLTDGEVYLFCNRARNRVKALYWDGSGLWVCAKRLEAGRFRWMEKSRGATVTLKEEEFMLIVKGLDPADFYQKKWFRK